MSLISKRLLDAVGRISPGANMQRMPSSDPLVRPRLRRACALVALAAITQGCGAEVYQKRLGETIAYFEYKEQLERELGREWSENGIRFRPPAQFSLIPPPEVPEGDDDGAVFFSSADDPRQPHYLGVELPGLLAAWEADVAVDSDDGQSDQKAYLYVLSNHDWYLQQEVGQGSDGDPQMLIADAENAAAWALNVSIPEGEGGSGRDKNRRHPEVVPGGLPHTKYRPQQNFTSLTLAPEVQSLDRPIEMQLYEWEGKKVQVVILMVYPANVSPQENLQDRLLLAMETFEASDQVSTGSGSGGAAAGTRQSGGF